MIKAGKKLYTPGTQKPIYLLNFITNSCNAACEHCFYWKKRNTNKIEELSIGEHKKIAKSLGSMFQITFTGGSPELRNDLPEIVYEYHKYCRPTNITVCMLGYHTKRIVKHIIKMLEICEGQYISIGISLDGIRGEHDSFRKLEGLFDRVLNTINELHLLRSSYPYLRIDIGMVVHWKNIETIEKSALWIREHLPIDKLKPILVRNNSLNPETRNDKCIELYTNIVDRDVQWLMCRNQGKMNIVDKFIRAKENVQRDIIKKISQSNQSTIKCSGGRETAVMYPNGDIAGCEMRHNKLGNIRNYKYDFKNVWFSNSANEFRKTAGNAAECNGCYHHCFISPAIFRTPAVWPKLAQSILKLKN